MTQPNGRVRVGFDGRWYNSSGVGIYVAELLKALASTQKKIELVLYEDPKNRISGLEDCAITRVPIHSTKYSALQQFELRQCCREDRIDVFHSPFYVVPVMAPCPVVVTFHDLIPFRFRIYSRPKQSAVKWGYRMAAKRSSRIIADSQRTAMDVREILNVSPEKISVVPLAVTREHFNPVTAPEELEHLNQLYRVHVSYVLVASARNWKTKNLESALKALSIVKHKHNLDFQTVVYGPIEGLEAACAGNDFYELNIVRLGYVPARELGMLYRRAALFIMPSLYEGFGLPVLEAMSCGCPVITSNSGALGELAGNGARTFSPQDVKGMADAAASLLRNPDEGEKWRKRALNRAADFSWEKAAEETANVYCSVYKTAAAARLPRQVSQQIELGGTREKSCEHSSRV